MAKLTLIAAATFPAEVAIPLQGGAGSATVSFTFKHRTRDELDKFVKLAAEPGRNEVDLVMEMAAGWDLEDEFTRENVALLLQNYIAAGGVIFERYLAEHTRASEKN